MTTAQTDRNGTTPSSVAMKPPCRVATTANITLSGLQTIDGVTVVAGDRVLVKDQTTTTDNGIYEAASSSWSRAADADGSRDLVNGSVVYVRAGSAGLGFWYCTATDTIVIGTSAISFARASSVLATISAYVQTLIDDTTAGAFLTTLGVSAFVQTLLDDTTVLAFKTTLGGTLAQIPVSTQSGAVATGTTLLPNDDTIPQNTEGDLYITAPAFTPKSATSTLFIDVFFICSHSVTNAVVTAALFQDATASALAAVPALEANGTGMMVIAFRHKMISGTTSATTFKVRAGGHTAGTLTFNGSAGSRILGGVIASSITITETLP